MDAKKERKWKLPKNIPKDFPKGLLRKDRLLIVLLAGILLVVIALPISSGKSSTGSSDTKGNSGTQSVTQSDSGYTEYIENHLEEVLSQVSGVGSVRVMVTLKASSEKIVEKDSETSSETVKEEDSQGGTRQTANNSRNETTVYNGGQEGIADSQGGQSPYVTKELSPVIEGVVVIAAGGDNPVTVQNITEAVQALFDIDTHKIKVMKLNQN